MKKSPNNYSKKNRRLCSRNNIMISQN